MKPGFSISVAPNVSNELIKDYIIYTYAHCVLYFLIVPGITGSQLDVRRTGFSLCSTLGVSIPLWVNEARILKFGCFDDEMK